jgi:hypothetical protein
LQLRLSSSQAGTRFDELRSQLDQQELALAERASRMLLDTFIRLLGGLIGAGLTQNILQVAWGSILPDAESKVEPDSDDPRGDP